jgi:hypothetical protein
MRITFMARDFDFSNSINKVVLRALERAALVSRETRWEYAAWLWAVVAMRGRSTVRAQPFA